jgi:hypothetical protein
MNVHQLDRAANLFEHTFNRPEWRWGRTPREVWKDCSGSVRERDADERIAYAHEGTAVLQDSDKRLIEHRYKEMEKEWEYRTWYHNQ